MSSRMGPPDQPLNCEQGSDHRLRWVGSALLFAATRWRRIQGHRHMPMLINALNAAYQLRCAHNQAELKAQVSPP